MKAFVFGALGAVALLAASPAFAATGYVGAAYSHQSADVGPASADDDIFGVEGAVAFNASASLGIDVDANYSDGDKRDSVSGINAHVYAKGGDYKVGGFVGVGDSSSDTVYSVGVEGQKSFDKWTLAAAAGYANDDDTSTDLYGVNGQARYFINDNFRLQGDLGWVNVDAGKGASDDAYTFGVGGEYQFAGAPVSVHAGYAHTEFNDADVSGDAFTVGVRYNWGGSLKDRDTNGPSFAGLSSLTTAIGL